MLLSMRTTIVIDDRLYKEIKRYAADRDRTVTSVIEEALQEVLARRSKLTKMQRIRLPAHGSGGLQPGVDLDHSAELWDLLDKEVGSP
jgi:hypothetical protein